MGMVELELPKLQASMLSHFWHNGYFLLSPGCYLTMWLLFYLVLKGDQMFYPFVMLQIFCEMLMLGLKLT
ncbi:hypothetical protein BHE74_00001148 [Ensete ventricosum]|uniref:Uncharacterized protein n=1 Tax=Ensete ventricosum TaxID=4639 RepID=A0A444F4U1_ENSVE|nr:hypothetical protein B296_00002816 [Ensete ventricosum]RWW17661.1 hypothetical protein GW17_00018401 [Ensete ventricosum]RWW89817.1 hypothetical protein BHE74_00001148 [Ensete ventricosum]RZS10139.1 hypothetical protein BHM03_00041310 [Ensete ventricosum]